MRILQNLEVPTGNIIVVEGSKGKLEAVSLGDYGKEQNIKADFLGLKKEIKKISHMRIMPLSEKWVCTISSQYGCSMSCKFCDVPLVGKGINATVEDLTGQIESVIGLEPKVKNCARFNIHFARMGEPSFNIDNIIDATKRINYKYKKRFLVHPVISSMVPKKNRFLKECFEKWNLLKTQMNGEAGLQLSINSTDEKERNNIFSNNASSIKNISKIFKDLSPVGRKFTLNFPLAGFKIDPKVIADNFDTKKFMIKITPMHKTGEALKNKIKTDGDYTTIYPYLKTEEGFKKHGFDVLVFLASWEEDMSRITCGNAILTGSRPETPYRVVHV